ncbi:multiple sugar transport system permease protein [Paenibacillus rhizosphaerae]|uniref:Multiple sugar transport system permease protein n=1 Tax=Paenibacillus rhizosphaerae TaxID=297318 RepID=A0A839TLZ4_9BACL|nr:sugar ABC transporter permease [Paenibacillus rhizosphaerae]MBB3127826.1 multiple sugar transport system permease protein [Paenibacillus rhizosphaerae]
MVRKETAWGYFFIAPMMIGFAVFMLYPFVYSFYLSLTSSDGIVAPKFIGFDNYAKLLKDTTFLRSLRVTLYFTLVTVPVGAALSLLAAMLLNIKMRFVTWYRTAFFLPVITSMVAIATVWKWLYNTDYGLINSIFAALGLYEPPWLASAKWALPSIMIMSIWKGIGFNMVIFLAGLQGISPSLYESAKIDGAGAFRRFTNITFPLLRHTTVFVVIMSIISSFQVFDQVYVMTQGGPAKSTSVVVYYIYQNAFQFFQQGYASAMAYVLFAIIFIVTLLQTRLAKNKDVDG